VAVNLTPPRSILRKIISSVSVVGDTTYIDIGELAQTNAQLVEKAVKIVESLGGSIASVDETRQLLNL